MNQLTEIMRNKSASRTVWFAVIATLLLVGSMAVRIHFAKQALPYCHHVDEDTWTQRSINILKTSDLNPHRFTKPSVMVYLNTAGMALGLVRAGARRDSVYQPKGLGVGGYPYYASPTAISTVRTMYAGLSVLAMLMAALCVKRMSGSRGVALLALFLMACSGPYLYFSWKYLNVDILGVFFAITAISYALLHAPTTPPVVVSLVMGLLSGFTLGTKYNLFWIAAPMLIVVLTESNRYRVERTILFLVSMVVGFLITTPYALFDVQAFVNQAAYEAKHYATGHKANTVDAGFPMFLAHVRHLTDNSSPLLLLASGVGAVHLARRDLRRTLILLSYPVLLFVYMISQRTFFPRNILIIHLFAPMLAAVGLGVVFGYLKERLSRVQGMTSSRGAMISAAALLISILLTSPWKNVTRSFDPRVESRNEVIKWADRHVPKKSRIVVAKQLDFDLRKLEKEYSVAEYDVSKASLENLRQQHPGAYVLVPMVKGKGSKIRPRDVDVLAEFGSNKVTKNVGADNRKRNRNAHVVSGDPAFVVAKL